MIEPLPAMYAALEAISEGKAAEIELDFRETGPDGDERGLMITVRSEVRHFVGSPTGGDA